jgi:small subunit ribosomal protein S20
MPITKSAQKAVRGSLRKKAINDRRRRAMKDAIKKFQKTAKTDKTKATQMLRVVFQVVDKAAKIGVIKKNNASRKKSRLSKLLK